MDTPDASAVGRAGATNSITLAGRSAAKAESRHANAQTTFSACTLPATAFTEGVTDEKS